MIFLSIDVVFYLLMFFERGGTVFQTAPKLIVYNPETSSRVALASLGIAFQPRLAYSVDSVRFVFLFSSYAFSRTLYFGSETSRSCSLTISSRYCAACR